MESEEINIIQSFLEILNASNSGLNHYDQFVDARISASLSKQECKRILDKMEGLGFISKNQIANYGGHTYIKIEQKGRLIVHTNGGYSAWLKQEEEKNKVTTSPLDEELKKHQIQVAKTQLKGHRYWIPVGISLAALTVAVINAYFSYHNQSNKIHDLESKVQKIDRKIDSIQQKSPKKDSISRNIKK